MKFRIPLLCGNLLVATCVVPSFTWGQEQGNITNTPAPENIVFTARLEVSDAEPVLAYEIRNLGQEPAKVDEIGVGSSTFYSRLPSGVIGGGGLIVDWDQGQAPPTLAPGATYSHRIAISRQLDCAVGLYFKWMQVKGVTTEKVALYHELEAPCIDSRFDEDMDSIRVVTDRVKQGRFEVTQRQRRQQQLEAFEGMKQYVMVNPYILAASVDGKPGFRVKLMATNNTQKLLQLPKFNTPRNRIEIAGYNKDDV